MQLVDVVVDVVDESGAVSEGGVEVTAGVDEFRHVAGRDQPWQPLEGADVGHYSELRLPHGEHRVGCRQPDVTSGNEIHSRPETVSVDRGDHRLGGIGEYGHRRLEATDLPMQ